MALPHQGHSASFRRRLNGFIRYSARAGREGVLSLLVRALGGGVASLLVRRNTPTPSSTSYGPKSKTLACALGGYNRPSSSTPRPAHPPGRPHREPPACLPGPQMQSWGSPSSPSCRRRTSDRFAPTRRRPRLPRSWRSDAEGVRCAYDRAGITAFWVAHLASEPRQVYLGRILLLSSSPALNLAVSVVTEADSASL
jgi:hypothetical protein